LSLGNPSTIETSAKTLSYIYKQEKKWDIAYDYLNIHMKYRDSARNTETEKDIIKKQASYDLEKREQEIILLSTKNELQQVKLTNNRKILVLISALALLFFIFIVIAYRNNQKKKIINQLLVEQNNAKANIIKEIHHRVKNNMAVVNSLLRRQSKDIKDPMVIDILKEAQGRVVSMAILHEKMYKADNLESVDIKEHIEDLVADLIKAYVVHTDIKLELNIQSVQFNMDKLVPIGLIINELVTNSLKYAFKDRSSGVIYLELQKKLNNSIELIIGDDGIGIKENKESDHMGTALINSFVKQLKGSIELLKKEGTAYRLVFSSI